MPLKEFFGISSVTQLLASYYEQTIICKYVPTLILIATWHLIMSRQQFVPTFILIGGMSYY